MAISVPCPRCRSACPVPAAGAMVDCDACGHRWKPSEPGSDEYMPAETGRDKDADRPLTQRRTPPRTRAPESEGGLPFDRLEAEAGSGGPASGRHPSDLAFRPSSDAGGPKDNCPVCGHSFIGIPGVDDQRCPQCGTSFSRSTGRLSAGSSGSGGDRLIGRTLCGCLIDRKLGEGGMGSVYHAKQLSLDRSVAIKVLPPELARNRNFIQRFEREAKSLARINHANILQIYDFGEDQQLGIYFMVIEYVDGWDLGEVLRRQPVLSQFETLDIVRQALLGLEQAADKGVIHRDIKPDNLMVAISGLCKVSDFGLAKGHGAGSEVTSIGVRVGTPAFMSPEQCDGIEVDSRSDVYNLGCTAYLMLTGHLPFDGETPFSIMLKHKVDPVPSLSAHRSGLDPRVEALVKRMLAKRPAERCRDLRELIDDAEHLLVELTGTASVLRKTNGPIRALVEHTQDKRPSDGSGSPTSTSAGSSVSEPKPARRSARHRSVTMPSPAAPSSPASGQPAGAPAIPEWLRPVDTAPGQAAATPAPAPPVGSRTASAAAISARSAAASTGSGRPGARTGLQSAQGPHFPGAPTPYPGPVTPLPEARPSASTASSGPHPAPKSSTSSSMLQAGMIDRARERGLRAEVAAISAGADRLAESRRWDAAAEEYRRAASLVRGSSESRRLDDLAATAARRGRGRRRLRTLAITGFSLALLGVNLWIWPPVVHRLLADRERARIDAVAEPGEHRRQLKSFIEENRHGWSWYRMLFMRGYEVPAVEAAVQELEHPASNPAPRVPRAPAPPSGKGNAAAAAIAQAERLAADPQVPLQQVVAAARTAGAAAILAEAENRLAAATDLRSKLDLARGSGRHGEALDLAARLATEFPRAGALLEGLPLPGRVIAVDADNGHPVPGLRLAVDGVVLAGTDGRFCRPATAETRIDVVAFGYAPTRVTLGPDAAREERSIEARLAPAPVWRLPAPPQRPAWLGLHAAGGTAVMTWPDGVAAVDMATGTTRPLVVAGTRMSPWWKEAEGGWTIVTADGEQRLLPPTLDRATPVRRLGGAPLALLDVELTFRSGRLAVAVEDPPEGAMVVAREAGKEMWRVPGVSAHSQPILRRGDDKIVAVDDTQVLVLEEDGRTAVSFPLKARRTGPWAELPGGRLLVATESGVELVQVGNGGARIATPPWLTEDGPAIPVVVGTELVLARSSHDIDILAWATDQPKLRLQAKIAGVPAQVGVGQGLIAIADEAGVITLLRHDDGSVARRISHGAPLAVPPVLLPGAMIVISQDGAVAGYRLAQ